MRLRAVACSGRTDPAAHRLWAERVMTRDRWAAAGCYATMVAIGTPLFLMI